MTTETLFLPKDGGSVKRNFADRASFTDQSLIRESNESALSSLKFFLFFLVHKSTLQRVVVGGGVGGFHVCNQSLW